MGTILVLQNKERPDSQNSPKKVMTAFVLICVEIFFLTGGAAARQVELYNPPVESEMCPTSHAQCESHIDAPVLCFLLPELYLPQLKLRAAPCSRTLHTSDLPSAVSKKSRMRGVPVGANKASTGFPLGKHPTEDEFCCLRDGSCPHPLVMRRTTGLVCLVTSSFKYPWNNW